MATVNEQKKEKVYRPKQVLLVGLGGVGSRIVDSIMSKVPETYRPYTQAISIDTDKNDIPKLKNIPVDNQIAIGEGVTIGGFMKANKDTADWMVKGEQLDLIREKNTSNGAKQIRLVSRIALAATNKSGGFARKVERVINKLNAVDGKMQGNGLLVLVVCSIAGGTGAGTVVQVPMYLEDAIKNAYSSENVQFECAMLMPGAFSETLSVENYKNAKINAYAVIRELMSLNTGRLKRFEYLDADEVDKTDERIAPYGRIMMFDDRNGEGEAVLGHVDTTHAPLAAEALAEYLFGPANSKITSALDNTLKRVYDTNGAGIFGAVGRANLVFPRVLYTQYAVSKWVSSSISDTWLKPDVAAKKEYREKLKKKKESGSVGISDAEKYSIYVNQIKKEKNDSFFAEIQRQLVVKSGDKKVPLAEKYWDDISACMEREVFEGNNGELKKNANRLKVGSEIKFKDDAELVNEQNAFANYYHYLLSLEDKVVDFANEIMCSSDAKKPGSYEKDNHPLGINSFMRTHNLHPIALRCFLYQLYIRLLKETKVEGDIPNVTEKSNQQWMAILKDKKTRNANIEDEVNELNSAAKLKFKTVLAAKMLEYVNLLVKEVEDLFGSVNKVLEYFNNQASDCIEELEARSKRVDITIVGSVLSMENCWKSLQAEIHLGNEEEEDIVDKDMCAMLNKEIFKGYIEHANPSTQTIIEVNGETFRMPTNYAIVLKRRLNDHFFNKIRSGYSNIFPENIVEAVKYDCGVKTCWNTFKHTVPHITLDKFYCENPTSADHIERAKQMGVEVFEPVDVLNHLLSVSVGKAEPRCGFVKFPDTDYTARYIVLNREILSDKPVFDAAEESTAIGVEKEETYIIPGVSTSNIYGVNVNACFDGTSKDIITCVTSYSGLEPCDFVAFLAPSSDKDAPQDDMNYYQEYRKYINKVVLDSTKITPHLHRAWHIADKLADITKEHTVSVWKHAARAFVYGFVYDVIKVTSDGSVYFGESNNKLFYEIDHTGLICVEDFLPADKRAVLTEIEDEHRKKDEMNAILNEIFVRLASDPVLRDAIIKYGEEKLDEDRVYGKADFVKNAATEEEVAIERYNCILDVIDGYYQGAMRAEHIEKKFAEESAQHMFDVLISTIFELTSSMTNDPTSIKSVCDKCIELLYKKAICDEIDEDDDKVEIDVDNVDDIFSIISKSDKVGSIQRPFNRKNGRFREENAKRLVTILLKENIQ